MILLHSPMSCIRSGVCSGALGSRFSPMGLALLAISLLPVASASTERITNSTFSAGAGITADTRYSLVGTVGQPFVGSGAGLWHAIVQLRETARPPLPTTFALAQNYPNPFNPTTTIQFAVPVSSRVRITLYDVSGRKIASLLDEYLEARTHTIQLDARDISTGVYFYEMRATGFVQARKLVILK